MAVGFPTKANWAAGDVLTAAQMDDLAATLNTVSDPLGKAAGKNAIINGDFGIWQRGTSFNPGAGWTYTADRWRFLFDGTGATRAITQQAFTAGTAPVTGYEGTYFCQIAQSVAGSGGTANLFSQPIEDVRTFAGQTITISFWAKAGASATLPQIALNQDFGSGGSAGVTTVAATSLAITTSWARYTATVAVPSITGKTIGTGSLLDVRIQMPVNTTYTIGIWGVQVEAGSYATNFQTATGTKQGELAACQRYYVRFTDTGSTYSQISPMGSCSATTQANTVIPAPVTMRTTPSAVEWSTVRWSDLSSGFTPSAVTLNGNCNSKMLAIDLAITGATQFRPGWVQQNNSTTGYLAFTAEL